MFVSRIVLPLCLLVLLALPAAAASFDCVKASTPFEHAICDVPDLSAADEVLAKAFATATGGLTGEALSLMRADQRSWLDFAQRACTDDAQAMSSGRYDDMGSMCLVDVFTDRNRVLEDSRMEGGHRFYLKSYYAALPDPHEVDNPDSYWKVATHELTMPLLDIDDPMAGAFNDYVTESALNRSDIATLASGGDEEDLDPGVNASVTLSVAEGAGKSRISLQVDTYWYEHGAAHGNWGITYLHYLTGEERGLVAGDVFAGKNWRNTLVEAAWAQLQVEHDAEWLQVETAADIAEIVVEPNRWDFSNDYGLVIQFEPYEVSAYAYGAPTITIPWDKLERIKADTQDMVRYGS